MQPILLAIDRPPAPASFPFRLGRRRHQDQDREAPRVGGFHTHELAFIPRAKVAAFEDWPPGRTFAKTGAPSSLQVQGPQRRRLPGRVLGVGDGPLPFDEFGAVVEPVELIIM